MKTNLGVGCQIKSFVEVCFMWLEVFESNQGDLPEDPSCLAGLASLEVLAVPRERESEFSQCCILTYTIQNSS